jgi:hypothetical protein
VQDAISVVTTIAAVRANSMDARPPATASPAGGKSKGRDQYQSSRSLNAKAISDRMI